MSRTVAIIQARLGSTRLPRKVLADICGKPMIQHVVDRALAINRVDRVCVAFPGRDTEIMNAVARDERVTYFAHDGDGDNVLGRFYYAARANEAETILRVTADCPLLDPDLCNAVRAAVWSHSFTTLDTRRSGFPDGMDCEGFTRTLLETAHERATDPYDREHVTAWMQRAYSSPGATPYPVFCREIDALSAVKISVDTTEDLERVRRIMARIPAGNYSWQATAEAIRAELSEKS